MQHIGKFDDKITCIPNDMEKYISFSLGKLVFLDSLQFLNSSLDNLVNNLRKSGLQNFKHTASEIADAEIFTPKNTKQEVDDDTKINLITRKGIYPYDYMDSFDKFKDKNLPPKDAFYSQLNDEHIWDADYQHAQPIWKTVRLKSMGKYHDLYLVGDVLLLTDVFESFRETCLTYYKLDPCHYYTAPGLAWDACLKMTKIDLELITDINKYLMVEKGIKGGISTITNRYSKANNKCMKDYNPDEETKYITYLDANYLYSWAMCQYLLTKYLMVEKGIRCGI